MTRLSQISRNEKTQIAPCVGYQWFGRTVATGSILNVQETERNLIRDVLAEENQGGAKNTSNGPKYVSYVGERCAFVGANMVSFGDARAIRNVNTRNEHRSRMGGEG